MESKNWGGAVNDAAPADTKTQVVVTPETVQNRNTSTKNKNKCNFSFLRGLQFSLFTG